MGRKLQCTIVDDDPESHHTIIELLKDSPIGEITHSFYKPTEFIENIHTINVDVVFLDIMFPNDTLQGFDIVPILKSENKIIIFISGKDQFIVEACRYAGAIDVVPKPNTKERLISALVKAWRMTSSPELNKKENELFYIAERKEQVNLLLSDFLFVKTAIGDPRNKEVILKNGKIFTLMDCKFSHLLQLSPKLIQINISQLVSYDIVDGVLHDTIYLKSNTPDEIPRILTLSKTYRQRFKTRIV